MPRSDIAGSGMAVSVSALRDVAEIFGGHADEQDRRIRAEAGEADTERSRVGAPNWASLAPSARDAIVPPPMPSWLDDADRAWQNRRAELVAADRAAASALVSTARDYQRTEHYIATLISAGDAVLSTRDLDSTSLHDTPAEPSRTELPARLDGAVALWSVRVRTCADASAGIDHSALDAEGWDGRAAQSYEKWLTAHRRRWDALRDDAERIRQALVEHTQPDHLRRDGGPRLRGVGPVGAPTLSPDRLDMVDEPPVLPSSAPVPADLFSRPDSDTDAGAIARLRPDPDRDSAQTPTPLAPPGAGDHVGTPATEQPSRSPSSPSPLQTALTPHPTDGPDDDQPSDDPTDDSAPTGHPALADPSAGHDLSVRPSSDDHAQADHAITESDDGPVDGATQPDHSADLHDAVHGRRDSSAEPGESTPPVVVIDNDPSGGGDAHATALALTAGLGTSAAAGVAAVAALGQQDRILHVITDIPKHAFGPAQLTPPPAPDVVNPTPPPPPLTGLPAPAPPSALAPPDPPTPTPSQNVAWSPALADGLSATQSTTYPGTPQPLTRRPRPHQVGTPLATAGDDPDSPTQPLSIVPPAITPSAARRGRIVVDLGAPSDPDTAIDLAMTGGLGVTGPGSADVARTLLGRLLTQPSPTPRLIAQTDAWRQLLGIAPPAPRELVHIVTNPYDALDRLADDLTHRPTHPERAPLLLLLPAPRDRSSRDHVHQALADAHPHPVTAVLLGPWPPGTTLTIAGDHTVDDHASAHADNGAGQTADLTGRQLIPTSAVELLDQLHAPPSAEPDDRRDHQQHHEDSTRALGSVVLEGHATAADAAGSESSQAPPAPSTRGTPLWLSVIGPVVLHLRDDPADPTTAQPIRINDRTAELLAFLAIQPHGVTRGEILKVLWPASRADRPEANLHNTTSELRQTVRRHTTADAADLGPVVVADRGIYRLDDTRVTVDYWSFCDAATHIPDADATPDRATVEIVVGLYRGRLAAGYHGDWLTNERATVDKRFVRGVNALIPHIVRDDPDRAVRLLHQAREHEPTNEALYRNLMEIHLRNGRPRAAADTYDLLRTALATIRTPPAPATVDLMNKVRNTTAHT